jgi:ABC-type multidrug transport system fused ATPase/permease subunit
MKEGTASKFVGAFLSTGFIVAAFSGLVSLLGTVYYSAYLNEWGLSGALFPAPPGWLSLVGYSSFLAIGGYVILLVVSGLSLWLILCVLASLLLRIPFVQSITERAAARLFTKRLKNVETLRFEEAVQRTAFWLSVAVWSFLTVLILIVAVLFVSRQGKAYANAERERLQSGSGKQTFEMSGGNSLRGRLVRCSTSHCAILSADTLRTVNVSDIEQIVDMVAGGA